MRVGMTKVVTRLMWTTSLNRAIRTMMIMKVCSLVPRTHQRGEGRGGERRGEERGGGRKRMER